MKLDLLSVFQWFHAHPEASGLERGTTAHIRDILTDLDIRLCPNQPKTGLLAQIGPEGPAIALRADIDALPVAEATGLSYASEIPGFMHACGHDFHTAALLGAAALLKEKEAQLTHPVRLIFQPAEESCSGALEILRVGGLEGVERIFGLHALPQQPAGTVFLAEGPTYAACDRFVINIRGVGCHAGHPDTGRDPIVAASHLIGALQAVVSRGVDPMEAAVISVTRFQAGHAWNIIPETAQLEGTLRTLQPRIRELVLARMEAAVTGTDAAFGTQTHVDWEFRTPSVINEAACTRQALQLARDLGMETAALPVSMGGEDFAYYLQKIPGSFLNIGTGGKHPLHHPGFTTDPAVLPQAARLLAELGSLPL